jgi:hypothetical protein
VYRGLEKLDEGIIPDKDEKMRFLSATRYVPIRDNPDSRLVNEYFEEAYVGGFNASFYLGWITERTTDYDLQNAYPTAMANIIDIDWEKPVRDFPKNYELSLQDIINPLIPSVAAMATMGTSSTKNEASTKKLMLYTEQHRKSLAVGLSICVELYFVNRLDVGGDHVGRQDVVDRGLELTREL